jgi:hypothetical protein
VLRLRTAGVSDNEIARLLNLAPSIVRLMLERLARTGLGWPLSAEMTDAALETSTPRSWSHAAQGSMMGSALGRRVGEGGVPCRRIARCSFSGRFHIEKGSAPLVGLAYSRFKIDTRGPGECSQFGDIGKLVRG